MNMERHKNHVNRNIFYQYGVPDVKAFCEAHGFDALVQIRGLQSFSLSTTLHSPPEEIRGIVRKFERFLKKTLTLPKYTPATPPTVIKSLEHLRTKLTGT
jgi:hypothetical protein